MSSSVFGRLGPCLFLFWFRCRFLCLLVLVLVGFVFVCVCLAVWFLADACFGFGVVAWFLTCFGSCSCLLSSAFIFLHGSLFVFVLALGSPSGVSGFGYFRGCFLR